MRIRTPLMGAVFVMAMTVPLSGCSSEPTTIIQVDSSAKEATGSLTPIQRGEVRREAMEDIRAGVEAWIANDLEKMRDYFDESQVERFEETWSPYRQRGLHIVHVHDVSFLDVFEMNADGTQVLASYKYDDTSYVADENGKKVEDLEPIKGDIRITADLVGEGEWKIVRIFASKSTIR